MKPRTVLAKVRRWVIKATVRVFALAAVGLVGLYGYVRYDFVSEANSLEAEIMNAKSVGLFLSSDEFEPKGIRKEDNAAPLLLVATQIFRTHHVPSLSFGGTPELLSDPETGPQLRAVLKQLSPHLDALVLASERPICAFEVEWKRAERLSSPEIAPIKSGLRWLLARAYVAAHDGRWEASKSDLRAVVQTVNIALKTPTVLHYLTQNQLALQIMISVASLATLPKVSAQQCQELSKILNELDQLPDIKHALKGEAFIAYSTARNLSRMRDEDLAYLETSGTDCWSTEYYYRSIFPPLIEDELVNKYNAARMLRQWRNILDLLDQPGANRPGYGKTLDDYVDKEYESSHFWDIFSALTLPNFNGITDVKFTHQTRRALTEAFVQAISFFKARGRFPESLDELGADSYDSSNDARLMYRRTSSGFRVWSAGLDSVDHNGLFQTEVEPSNTRYDDLVLAYPLSEEPKQGLGSRSREGWIRELGMPIKRKEQQE